MPSEKKTPPGPAPASSASSERTPALFKRITLEVTRAFYSIMTQTLRDERTLGPRDTIPDASGREPTRHRTRMLIVNSVALRRFRCIGLCCLSLSSTVP